MVYSLILSLYSLYLLITHRHFSLFPPFFLVLAINSLSLPFTKFWWHWTLCNNIYHWNFKSLYLARNLIFWTSRLCLYFTWHIHIYCLRMCLCVCVSVFLCFTASPGWPLSNELLDIQTHFLQFWQWITPCNSKHIVAVSRVGTFSVGCNYLRGNIR